MRIIDLMSQVQQVDAGIRTSKQFIQRDIMAMSGAHGADDFSGQ